MIPVFGFATDTNTFIGRPDADTIAFTHGGSEKVRIAADGKVGIGTDNPESLLHLEGTGGTTSGLRFKNGVGKNVSFYLNNNTSSSQFSINYGGTGGSDIQISHNGQVVLAPSGLANIGIGTYTPLYKLDVRGSIGGFDGLRAPHSDTVKTYAVTVATKDATHRYQGTGSNSGYKIDGEFSPFITLTPGRTYRFDQSDNSNATHQIKFYLEADKTTLYEGGVTYNGTAGSSGAYTQIVVGDETPVVLHYQCINHEYMGNAVQVNSNVVNTNYDAFLRGNLSVTGISTFSGNVKLPDDKSISFGNSDDLVIQHSSSDNHSYIRGKGAPGTTEIRINAKNNQLGVHIVPNAEVKLGYNGNQKFTTTDAGVSITGITTTTQLEIGTLGQSLVGITTILDEDNMASDSAAALATQQSIKKYVDDRTPQGPGGGNLAVSADSGSNESINLNTEVLDIEGTANEIETATGTNKVVIGLPDNVSIGGSFNAAGIGTFGEGIFIPDEKRIRFGNTNASPNFSIYSTPTYKQGIIDYTHSGTGRALRVRATTLQIENWNGLTPTAKFIGGVGAGHVELNYAGSKKFETTSSGVGIAGSITVSNDLNVTGISTLSNTTFTGTISAGSTTGTDGYYLKTTGVGVTWAQFPTARNSQTFTATAGQTTFSFTYNIGLIDVFVNGVKLPTSEFTANNGTSVILDDGCFVNDTVELITYNTAATSSGGGASNLNGLADITITGSPVVGEILQHNGSEFVNDYTVSATTTSTSQTAILSLPVATYRSAEYTIQVTEGTKYHVTKVLAIHDGTNVTFNEFGTLTTSTSLSTFALDINSGNMRLLATPASTNSTVFKVKFTGIKV